MSLAVTDRPTGSPRARWNLREWAIRILLIGFSLSFFLAFGEIAARVLKSGQQGGKEGREDAQYKEYDPLLGWRKARSRRATYRRREYTVDVSINSQGLRDVDRSIDPEPNTFRVLALGDSFLEGYTVDLNQTVTQLIESRLNTSGCVAEVINGGTSAYSTDQEYLFYASEGARYRPSLVILFFFWNDVLYSDRQDYFGTPKPVFEMGGGDLKLHRYPVREKPKEAQAAALETDDESEGSALLGMIRERLWLGAPVLHDRLASLGLWNPIPRVPPRLEMLVYDRRDLAPIEDAWEKVGVILNALKEDVERHGSRLAVAYVPGKMEIQEASWKATQQMYRLKDGAWRLDKVRDKLQKIGTASGIPVIDLRPALVSAERVFSSTYFTFDGHWNARGHDVAAQAVFEWIKTTGSLPERCGGTLPLQAVSSAVRDFSSAEH